MTENNQVETNQPPDTVKMMFCDMCERLSHGNVWTHYDGRTGKKCKGTARDVVYRFEGYAND